ncbi:MAG: hypothetical protein EZS28_029662, partial [Streblomastix strix]
MYKSPFIYISGQLLIERTTFTSLKTEKYPVIVAYVIDQSIITDSHFISLESYNLGASRYGTAQLEENPTQDKLKTGLEAVQLESVAAIAFASAYLDSDIEITSSTFERCTSVAAKYQFLTAHNITSYEMNNFYRLPVAGAVAFNIFVKPETGCIVKDTIGTGSEEIVDEYQLTLFCNIKQCSFTLNSGHEAGAVILIGSSYEISMFKCKFERNSAISLGDYDLNNQSNNIISITLEQYVIGNDLFLLPNPCNFTDDGLEVEMADYNGIYFDGYITSIYSSTSTSNLTRVGHSWASQVAYDYLLENPIEISEDDLLMINKAEVYVNWQYGNDEEGTGDNEDGKQIKTVVRALEMVDWMVESKIYLSPHRQRFRELFIRGFDTQIIGVSDEEIAQEKLKQ